MSDQLKQSILKDTLPWQAGLLVIVSVIVQWVSVEKCHN